MRDLLSTMLRGIRYCRDQSGDFPTREQTKHELRQQEHFSFGDNLQRIEPEQHTDDVWDW